MPLLDDIIQAGVDGKSNLSNLLRQCLLLAHQLKHSGLKSWANQELNGYSSTDNLPEYRIMTVGATGHFVGSFHSEMTNYPIPSLVLEKRHRVFAEKIYLTQAISAYESSIGVAGGSLMYEWPSDLCLYYQNKLLRGYGLVRARQQISTSSVVEMLDTIRNRTLNMALEIKEELGDTSDFSTISTVEAQRVNETITQNVFNGPAYFSSGNANVSVSADTNNAIITAGDRRDLDRVLLASGLEQSEIDCLSQAITKDGKPMGSSVSNWIRQSAPKILAGGVKITTAVAQSLLTDWLRQFYGLK